ncbi:TIGR02147 family protein [bacterium]|nr:TIGR02147 family protein [bacterium]
MKTALRVFDYLDPVEFLEAVLKEKSEKNAAYSLRSFARDLGIEHPSLLSRVFNRKTKPTLLLIKKVSTALNLSEKENIYLEGLLALSSNPTDKQKQLILDSIYPLKPEPHVELDAFHLVQFLSTWLNVAVFECLMLDVRPPADEWISKRLGWPTTPEMIQESLNLLEKIEFVRKLPSGIYERIPGARLKYEGDAPNSLVQRFHERMLKRGLSQLDYMPYEKRDMRSCTICLSDEAYKKSVHLIRETQRKIVDLAQESSQGSKDIYQLSTFMFSLSNGKEI